MTARVLHVIDTGGPGGAESVFATILGELDPAEFESRVVLPYKGWLYARLIEQSINVTVIPPRPSPDWRLLVGLAREVLRFSPDLLHTHLLTSSVYGAAVASVLGALPVVATFHGLPDLEHDVRLTGVKARLLSRPKTHVVFVAEHLRLALQPRMGVRDSNCHVIPNGIRFGGDPTSTLSGNTSHPSSGGRVGAVGNIRPAKDYSTLLRAAQFVCNDFSGDVQFEIAGEGSAEDVEALQALRNTLGLQANVSFVGFVPDVRAFLRSLDVFVSSSVTEGLPLAVLEAAGAACPIVATRCGGNEEVLAPAGDDSLVPPRNPEVLARAIVSALADPHRARRSAVRVAKQVRARFSIEQMIRGYSKLYQQVVRS